MKKKDAKFESIFHFDRLFTKLKINANGAGSLRMSCKPRENIDAMRRCDFDAKNITRTQLPLTMPRA